MTEAKREGVPSVFLLSQGQMPLSIQLLSASGELLGEVHTREASHHTATEAEGLWQGLVVAKLAQAEMADDQAFSRIADTQDKLQRPGAPQPLPQNFL